MAIKTSLYHKNMEQQRLETEFRAAGIKRSFHGVMYQLKLLMLFVKKGINQKYIFRLYSEMDAAEKFDDVVFIYKSPTVRSEDWTGCFLQAKHTLEPKKNIKINALTTEKNGNYSLQKYFLSFCKIENNEYFKDVISKHFIICTNASFDLPMKNERWKDKFEENEELDDCFLNAGKTKGIGKKITLKGEAIDLIANEIRYSLLKKILLGLEKEIEESKSGKTAFQDLWILVIKNEKNTYEKVILIYDAENAIEEAKDIKREIVKSKLNNALKAIKKVLEHVLELISDKVIVESLKNINVERSQGLKSNEEKIGIEDRQTIKNLQAKLQSNMEKLNGPDFKSVKEDVLEEGEFILKTVKEIYETEATFKESELNKLMERYLKLVRKEETKNSNGSSNSQEETETKEVPSKSILEIENTIGLVALLSLSSQYKKKIEEFIKIFCFVTNYVNEEKLDVLIKNEFKDDEILDSFNIDLIIAYFQNKMLTWLKMYNKGYSHLLSSKDAEAFLIDLKISCLNTIYIKELKGYEIHFENHLDEVRNFLSNHIQVLHLVTQAPRLSAIKVWETIEEYHSKDSCIFMNLKTLLNECILEGIIEAFASSKTHHLLVIESHNNCTNSNKLYIANKLSDALKRSQSKEKKILVIAEDDILVTKFKNYTKYYDDEISLKDLRSNSRDKILKRDIIFQGYSMVLKQLLNKNAGNNIIDSTILSRLVEEEQIEIGDQKASFSTGYVEEYYINRTLHQQKIKTNIFVDCKKNKSSLLFVISGASKYNLIELHVEENDIHSWENGRTYANGIVLVTPNQNCQEIFDKLCKNYVKNGVHWFHYNNGELIWRACNGSLLEQYIDKNISNKNNTFEEEDFNLPEQLGQKVIILSKESGTGKSTVLTSIAHEMKLRKRTLWIVRINLNDYASPEKKYGLGNIHFDGVKDNINDAIKFLSGMILPDSSDSYFEKKLFEYSLKKPPIGEHKLKILFFFDGFDEICPTYKEKTCALLKQLKKSNILQFWVTTRTQEKSYLEEKLESPAYVLNDFDERDIFLNNFWKWRIKKMSEDLLKQQKEHKQ